MSKHVIVKSVAALAAAALLAGLVGTANAAPAQTGAHRVAGAHMHRHGGANFMSGPMARRMMGMVGPMLGGSTVAAYLPAVSGALSSGALSGMGGAGFDAGSVAALAGLAGEAMPGAAPSGDAAGTGAVSP